MDKYELSRSLQTCGKEAFVNWYDRVVSRGNDARLLSEMQSKEGWKEGGCRMRVAAIQRPGLFFKNDRLGIGLLVQLRGVRMFDAVRIPDLAQHLHRLFVTGPRSLGKKVHSGLRVLGNAVPVQ